VTEVPRAFGHPEDPLTEEQNEEKFRRCLRHAREPLPTAQADEVLGAVNRLEALEDVALLARLTQGGGSKVAA
jgi:2-methylcitrate dehydratase PrpD